MSEEEISLSDTDSIDRPMFELYNRYITMQKKPVIFGIIFSIGSRILDLLPPLLIALAIDAIFLNEAAYNLFLIPDSVTPQSKGNQLVLTVLIVTSAFSVSSAFHWVRNWGWNVLAQRTQHNMRTDAYDSMQKLGMPFFAEHQTGQMMSVLSNDANRLERFLNDGLNSFFRLLVMVIGIGGILVFLNWQLAIIALLPIPILVLFTTKFIQVIEPKYEKVRSSVGDMNSRLENNLGGMRIIKTSTTEEHESGRVEDESSSYLNAQWDAIKTRIKFFPGLRLTSGLGFAATFGVGGYWVLNGPPLFLSGSLSPGEFTVFVLYTQRFVWPVSQFGQIINKYQKARASARRIITLVDMEPDVVTPDSPEYLRGVEGEVVYDDVTFGYEDDTDVLDSISFKANPGETVALVGPTGAGKSTILKLLLRMYDIDSGSITIDGVDLRDMDPRNIRGNIGYVSQNPFMFEGSVMDNIKYGNFDVTDQEAIEASKAAQAHGFVTNLTDGYDSIVGERGVKLSGGQRQRIAIARAILQDPGILILDEATSDVDTETEMLIQKSINQITEDRTTFAIAHRLSTIKDADKIIVIEDGDVSESGTHEELLDAEGTYANLWYVQAGEISMLSEDYIEQASNRRDTISSNED